MPDKINALTSEQERQLFAFREEMLAYGRSTAPADRDAAERAFAFMYARLGKPAPAVLWFDGPATASMARAILTDNLGDNLRANLWANLGANLWANLGANLRDNLGDNLGDNLRANLWANLGANLWANLGANLRDNLRDNLRANLGANLRANLNWPFGGQQDLVWWPYYAWPDAALRPMHDAESRAILNAWMDIGKSCNWWHPYDGAVIACERPSTIALDENGLLHSEVGPAYVCRDGWEFSAWHGVTVPCHWIKSPDQVDPSEVLRSQNVEQRAAGAAIIGWPRMLSKLEAKTIHDSGDPSLGQLIELTLPGLSEPGRFLKAECPRNGTICEGVPRISDIDGLPIETAIAAQAWRIGDPQSEYQHPITRT